jgi:hypothetical protein
MIEEVSEGAVPPGLSASAGDAYSNDLRQAGRYPLLARGEAEPRALAFLPKLAGKFGQFQCNSIGNAARGTVLRP